MAILGSALFGTSTWASFSAPEFAAGFVIHFQIKVTSNMRNISEVIYLALLVYALTLLIVNITVFCTLNGWVPAGSSISSSNGDVILS